MTDSYSNLTEGDLGAVALPEGGVRFRVWAPFARQVQVEVDGKRFPLEPEDRGYHAGAVEEAGVGSTYGFVLASDDTRADEADARADVDGRADGSRTLPDPASRLQPSGVHGLSEVVAAADPPPAWDAPDLRDLVVVEVHVGTASTDGTFDGLDGYVGHLASIGVNAVELMPVAEFPGERNWGYDGVFPYAVHHGYGGPDGLRRFALRCHERGVAVILDVVYNHLGPEGNVLREFGPYFTDRYRTPWGDAVNFDGAGSDEVRRFFGGNALMWFEEFGIDALRIDAIHGIVDTTARPFLMELNEAAAQLRERTGRRLLVIAESDLNDVRTVTPRANGGTGFDAQWNDDFHHAVHALVTGEDNGYYADFGRVRHLADAFQHGFVQRGGWSRFRNHRHGSDSSGIPCERFVVFAQNHDQIGNRLQGDRLSSNLTFELQKLVLGLTLLAPGVPLLFQGEEYGEHAPFPYFISHEDPDLVDRVRAGRREEFASFEWQGEPPDPQAEATFESARIDPGQAETGPHAHLLAWTRELIRLRRGTPALRGGVPAEAEVDEDRRVLGVWREEGPTQALLVANFGVDDHPAPDGWDLALHSCDERWGGPGTPASQGLPPNALALWLRPSRVGSEDR